MFVTYTRVDADMSTGFTALVSTNFKAKDGRWRDFQ